MIYVYVVVALLVLLGAFAYMTKAPKVSSSSSPEPLSWKERGEVRGRSAARSEPEAHVHIKVTRADGRVETYGHNPLA